MQSLLALVVSCYVRLPVPVFSLLLLCFFFHLPEPFLLLYLYCSEIMWKWLSRCVPGLSLLSLLILLLLAFPETASWIHMPWSGKGPAVPSHHGNDHWKERQVTLSLAQKIFIGYTVFVHGNAFTFSLRLAWALSQMVRQTRAVLRRRPLTKTLRGPAGSDSPIFADSPIDTPDPMSFDLGALEDGEQGEVVHAIILPNYSEDLDTLETTLKVLASHPRAATQYEVCVRPYLFQI